MIMMINNSKNINYYERKRYIEETLRKAFEPAIDFDDLKYVHENNMDGEYIKYSNTLGLSLYLDITSYEDYQILDDVTAVVLRINQPKSIIQDIPKLRSISNLFKEGKC